MVDWVSCVFVCVCVCVYVCACVSVLQQRSASVPTIALDGLMDPSLSPGPLGPMSCDPSTGGPVPFSPGDVPPHTPDSKNATPSSVGSPIPASASAVRVQERRGTTHDVPPVMAMAAPLHMKNHPKVPSRLSTGRVVVEVVSAEGSDGGQEPVDEGNESQSSRSDDGDTGSVHDTTSPPRTPMRRGSDLLTPGQALHFTKGMVAHEQDENEELVAATMQPLHQGRTHASRRSVGGDKKPMPLNARGPLNVHVAAPHTRGASISSHFSQLHDDQQEEETMYATPPRTPFASTPVGFADIIDLSHGTPTSLPAESPSHGTPSSPVDSPSHGAADAHGDDAAEVTVPA